MVACGRARDHVCHRQRGRREAIIPLCDDLRKVLASIPKLSPTILTNQRHRPWKRNGFGTAFKRAKISAGMNDRDLHFHDMTCGE
jgi:hypothetical protein